MAAKKKASKGRNDKQVAKASTSKTTADKNLPIQEERRPFALVVYSKDHTRGVVESKDIPKKARVKGSTCNVPNPIDWCLEKKSTEKNHPAKVVEFGRKFKIFGFTNGILVFFLFYRTM